MTISEFKFTLSDTSIGGSGTGVIGLFNTSSLGTTIDAIALRINETNPLLTLQQITTINIALPQVGEVVHIPVTDSILPYRLINKSVVENYFLYEIYPENQRPVIIPPTTGSNKYQEYTASLLLEPGTTQQSFSTNDYNILIGNAQESRESIYAYKLDRTTLVGTGSNPRNLPSIIADNAERADIQDSSYSITGWTNARYEGTKVTTTTNGNTDPFISAIPVQGAFYEKGVLDSYIVAEQQANTVKYEEYFFNGTGTVPTYKLISTHWLYYTARNTGFNNNTTQIVLTIQTDDNKKNQIQITDLLRIESGSTVYEEILGVAPPTTVTSYYPFNNITPVINETYSTGSLNIVRGYNGTYKTPSIVDLSGIYRINPVQIYKRDGAGFQAIREGKFITNGSTIILNIDPKGRVVSGSITEYDDNL